MTCRGSYPLQELVHLSDWSGCYPCPFADTAGSMVVSQAGGLVLTETIAAVRLDRELSRALARWRLPLAIHDPGKVVRDLGGAVTLAPGGECLADLALVGAEAGVYGAVASDPTVSRTIARLAADAPAVLAAIAAARTSGSSPGVAAGRRTCSRSGLRPEPAVDHRRGCHPGHGSLRQGRRRADISAGFRPPPAVELRRSRPGRNRRTAVGAAETR